MENEDAKDGDFYKQNGGFMDKYSFAKFFSEDDPADYEEVKLGNSFGGCYSSGFNPLGIPEKILWVVNNDGKVEFRKD